MKVLAFGEILWDVYPDRKYLGGAPLNFAAHLAKHAEEAYMLSSVGEDELFCLRLEDGVVTHHRELEHHLVHFGIAVAADCDDLFLQRIQDLNDLNRIIEVRYAVSWPVVE